MKIHVYLLPFLIIISCTPSVRDKGDLICMEDPEVRGLIPYHQVSFNVKDDFMPEYDSIRFFYDIVIDRPSWSDTHHDSIKIQRHKHTHADSNFWDRAEIYGIKHGTDEWTTICQLNIDEKSDREYYSMLVGFIDVISSDLEETRYYIDDEDWRKNEYFYQNYMGKDWHICGTIKIR